MSEHNDSHARRSNGPLRRANYDKINWTKREPGPSSARKAQIQRVNEAIDREDWIEAQRLIECEPIAD
jgi:hypothetical protein